MPGVFCRFIGGMVLVLAVTWFAASVIFAGFNEQVAAKPDEEQVTVPEARRQAALLHTTLHATLQAMHHRYYREDAGLPIPAATVKEIFAELEQESSVKLRWLVVEGQAMNTDHQAKTPFERDAVDKLKSGSPFVEETRDGTYRRAAPITLTSHCLKCHVPDRKSTKNRTAGLIISMPVIEE